MKADRRSQAVGRAVGGVLALGGLLAVTLALGGCSTSIADLPVGSAADTPAPHEPNGYLPVHDLPPDRQEAIIPPEQRAKIQAELTKARDHQATVTGAAAPTPPAAAPATKASTPPRQSRPAKPPAGESRAED
jgi:hypothetical protein